MAHQGLMCVWQALSASHPSLQGEACEKGVLRTLSVNFCRLPHTKGSISVFDDVFRDNDVITLEQYYTFVDDHLRGSSYAMCLLEDEIEQVCWELSKEALQEQGYVTGQILKQLWQIFGRLSKIGSLPPVLQSSELEWLLQKLKLGVSTPDIDLTFTEFLEVIDINGPQQSGKTDSLQKAIDSVHSWMVREVLMTGWMWKRTRKQANWTIWLKRWFVLTPGQLAYYDGPKLKERKGAVDITKRTTVTDLPDTRRFGWRLTGCFGLENCPFLQVELATMEDAEKAAWMTALTEVKGAILAGSTPMKRVLSRRLKSGKKSNLLDLPFMRPRSKSPVDALVRPSSSKIKKLKCTDCSAGVKSRKHISMKEPVLHRRLKKMTSIPEDQKQKIRNIFFGIDKDGSGTIDSEEFSEFLHKLGLEISQREADLIFESIQEKQGGKITMEGFYIYFVKTILHESSSTCAERRLQAAFLDADRNQTGTINFREYVEYVWERRRSIRISRVLKTFEEMDKDGSGEVDYGEFMDFLRKDPSFCEELCLTKSTSTDEETGSSDDHGDDDDDNNSEDSERLIHQAEELQRVLYEDESIDDPKVTVDFLRKRWKAFVSFKRPGASGDIVLKGVSGIVSDVLPGEYNLLDLAAFSDLPPLIPKHAHLQNVVWESADLSNSNSHGRVIFPADFDGVIPVQIATTELLRFYGCSLANAATVTVSLMYRHAIQDFTYENQYINEYVANTQKQAGAGLEKHDFSHLDMPLDDAGGYMLLAKLEDGEMHMTAFVVPTRHCLYLPGGTIHSNDYLSGTWRTMLSDEAPIDHCHLIRRSDTAEGGLEKFMFTFK